MPKKVGRKHQKITKLYTVYIYTHFFWNASDVAGVKTESLKQREGNMQFTTKTSIYLCVKSPHVMTSFMYTCHLIHFAVAT